MNAGSDRRPEAQVDSITVFIPPERLVVVDVLTDPAAALEAGALVTPSLRIHRGDHARWFLGDLTDQRDLLAFLS